MHVMHVARNACNAHNTCDDAHDAHNTRNACNARNTCNARNVMKVSGKQNNITALQKEKNKTIAIILRITIRLRDGGIDMNF